MKLDEIVKPEQEVHQDKKDQVEYKLIGSLKYRPGHTLFIYDREKGVVEEAPVQGGSLSLDYKTGRLVKNPKKLTIKKGCIYVSALNKKNAIKKLIKEGYYESKSNN